MNTYYEIHDETSCNSFVCFCDTINGAYELCEEHSKRYTDIEFTIKEVKTLGSYKNGVYTHVQD
jgi:hypothetical protein